MGHVPKYDRGKDEGSSALEQAALPEPYMMDNGTAWHASRLTRNDSDASIYGYSRDVPRFAKLLLTEVVHDVQTPFFVS